MKDARKEKKIQVLTNLFMTKIIQNNFQFPIITRNLITEIFAIEKLIKKFNLPTTNSKAHKQLTNKIIR